MDIKNLSSNKGNILDEVYIIKPKVFQDDRGFSMRVGINNYSTN